MTYIYIIWCQHDSTRSHEEDQYHQRVINILSRNLPPSILSMAVRWEEDDRWCLSHRMVIHFLTFWLNDWFINFTCVSSLQLGFKTCCLSCGKRLTYPYQSPSMEGHEISRPYQTVNQKLKCCQQTGFNSRVLFIAFIMHMCICIYFQIYIYICIYFIWTYISRYIQYVLYYIHT